MSEKEIDDNKEDKASPLKAVVTFLVLLGGFSGIVILTIAGIRWASSL